MKITVEELLDAKEALDKVLGKTQDVKLSYRIKRIAAKILLEQRHIDTTRIELFEKHGATNENNMMKLAPDKVAGYQKDWRDFIKTEIELEITAIPFVCYESVELSAYDLAILDKFLEEPKPEELGEKLKEKNRKINER